MPRKRGQQRKMRSEKKIVKKYYTQEDISPLEAGALEIIYNTNISTPDWSKIPATGKVSPSRDRKVADFLRIFSSFRADVS